MTFRRQYRRDINCHILSGRLSKDPEFKYGKQEPHVAVIKFQLATMNPWGNISYTWVKCFGPYAEMLSKRLVKGTWVIVQGPNYSKLFHYTGGGKKRQYFIVADRVTFLDGDRPKRKDEQMVDTLLQENNPDIMEVPDYDLGL